MSYKALLGRQRIVATLWRQLCSSLLHNWKFVADREVCWQ
jgi:hypothetical protein